MVGPPGIANHVCAMAISIRKPRTYHTAPPGRPEPSVRRSLPVRLSRGFIPGGVRRFANQYSRGGPGRRVAGGLCGDRLFLLEAESILPHIDDDAIALVEMALE